MLKRIFKTIFILALCFGTIESIYAALSPVSVSEGSAFVTKAEFRALVNEASTRIETLELHSDRQISVVVDSFLERNNIWHPQKQTLTSNTEIELIPADITLSSNSASGTAIISDRKTCIEQVKKSGMMIISLYYKAKVDPDSSPASKAYRWGYIGNMTNNGNWTSDNGTELVIKFFEETRNGFDTKGNIRYNSPQTKYTCLIGTTQGAKRKTGDSDTGYVCVIALSPEEVMIPAYFFESRNSRISWDAEQLYKFALTSTCDKVCDGTTDVGLNIIARINDPEVY